NEDLTDANEIGDAFNPAPSQADRCNHWLGWWLRGGIPRSPQVRLGVSGRHQLPEWVGPARTQRTSHVAGVRSTFRDCLPGIEGADRCRAGRREAGLRDDEPAAAPGCGGGCVTAATGSA